MKCPYCGSFKHKVLDSRETKDGLAIRRRRECENCGNRFTTYEYVEKVSIYVIKSDGRREPFSREKIKTGIEIACKKRPVSIEKIENIVRKIEEKIFSKGKKEIDSSYIGQLVMEELYLLDEVAYVRFASVYKKFKDSEEFIKELENIKGRK
jgi:transcriptional repressor NrdR